MLAYNSNRGIRTLTLIVETCLPVNAQEWFDQLLVKLRDFNATLYDLFRAVDEVARPIDRVAADDTIRLRDVSYRIMREVSATELIEPQTVL